MRPGVTGHTRNAIARAGVSHLARGTGRCWDLINPFCCYATFLR